MNRDYVYLASTQSLCPVCLQPVNGKIIWNSQGVFVLRRCPEHGAFRELLEEDAAYHLRKSQFDKPGTVSSHQTDIRRGCPFDCGLCPDHDQHTCIGLIEVTRRCNLRCGTCFANGGEGRDLPLDKIAAMMDFFLAAEGGRAEILQISGGEPTLHPDILAIIRQARSRNFGYIMLNTNGLRLAEDPAFTEALAEFRGGFEVYLQFDGLSDAIYRQLRGQPLLAVKQEAIRQLNRFHIPTTLVYTVAAGINDQAIGETLAYGMAEPCVRGVNFQPLAYFGRLPGQIAVGLERQTASPAGSATAAQPPRITLSGVLNRIEDQTSQMIRQDDFIPLPCNVERVAITYLIKHNGAFIPITRGKDMRAYKDVFNNTFLFTIEDTLGNLQDKDSNFGLGSCCDLVRDLRKFIPKGFLFQSKADKIRFVDENTFRISVSSFVDTYNFDRKSMQKECVHIITPGLKRIPFSAYNMLHRGDDDAYYL